MGREGFARESMQTAVDMQHDPLAFILVSCPYSCFFHQFHPSIQASTHPSTRPFTGDRTINVMRVKDGSAALLQTARAFVKPEGV